MVECHSIDSSHANEVDDFFIRLHNTTYIEADGFEYPIDELPLKWGKVTGLHPSLIEAVIWAESRGKKDAKRWEGSLGTYSYGLMQITPDAAQEVGYSGKPDGLMEPNTNVQYGSKYLSKMYKYNKQNIAMAVASYNCGLGGARQKLKIYGDPINFPEPTGTYVKSILTYYRFCERMTSSICKTNTYSKAKGGITTACSRRCSAALRNAAEPDR